MGRRSKPMNDALLNAVKDVLAQYENSTAALEDDFVDALLLLQTVYLRETGQPDFSSDPATPSSSGRSGPSPG